MGQKMCGMVRACWLLNMDNLLLELNGYSDYARELVLSCPLAVICASDPVKE